MIKLEWWNTCDLADVMYQTGFRQLRYYKDTEISEPEYEFNEEGVNNGDDEFVPFYQKLRKKYHMDIVVPEFELDALTMLPMHDNVWLTDNIGNTSSITNIEVQPQDWAGRWIRVRLFFSTHYYTKTPRCVNKSIGLPA